MVYDTFFLIENARPMAKEQTARILSEIHAYYVTFYKM